MKLKGSAQQLPNRWRDILDSLRKSGSRELKERVYQLCHYYQWYFLHNQMIQKKRFPAGLRYKYLLWRIWLVPPYALVNMLSLSSRAGEPMRKNANKHIYLKKSCAFTIFPDEMCKWRQIQFPPTSALVNLFWQLVVGWRENLLCKLFVTLQPSRKWCFKRRRTQASLSRLAWLSLEKGVPILATMLHKSSGWAARDWLHVLWEPTFQQRVCVTVARKMFGDK